MSSTPDKFNPMLAYTTIQGIVYKYAPFWIDRESLIHDLWLWCFENKCPPAIHILRKRIISRAEKEYLRMHPPELPVLDQEPSPTYDPEVLDRITSRSNLDQEDQQYLYLHYYEGMTFTQIAKYLKVSKNSVVTKMENILTKLRRSAAKEPN